MFVAGIVRVSVTPSIGRIISPTKCSALSLLSASNHTAKSQLPKTLYDAFTLTPSIGRSEIALKELKKGNVFDGFNFIKTRYFCMFFCIKITRKFNVRNMLKDV